jgi:hypothetical protein
MAGIKISALPPITASAVSDVAPFVQDGVTYQVSNSQLITLFNAQLQLASASQVTGLPATLAGLAPLAGATFTGTVLLNGTQTASNAAATVAYAQSIAAGLNPIAGVIVATTANLNTTYSNGVSGVGATLTDASGTFAAFTVDGQSPAVGSRVLVKNQTTTYQNGIYVLTTNGDTVSVPYVLTRATDYNMPSQIAPGDLTSVELGTANAGSTWFETATVVTIGVSAITWSVFFSPATYLKVANNLSDVASEPTAFANLRNYTTTATAATTTTLTAASTFQQFFTGTTTQTILLPVTSTLQLGQSYYIVNNSTGVVTVQSSGGNTIQAMAAGTTLMVTAILLTGTTAASWYANYGILPGGALTLASLKFNPTTGGIVGTTTNDNAAAGNVGEFVSSVIAQASPVNLPNGVPTNITSISLTAGDWDAWGNVSGSFTNTSGSIYGWVSLTSATQPDNSLLSGMALSSGTIANAFFQVVPLRVSISTTTTVYLSANSTFSGGTSSGVGGIYARRVR